MLHKKFAERLNQGLDNIDVPEESKERIIALSKILKVPKFKAETLLNGAILPDAVLLNALSEELEVNADWLLGKSDSMSINQP